MLLGYSGLNLPTDVPANQYVTFKGGKASASRGVGLTVGEALDRFEPDALRYALAANLPETSDVDLTEDEMVRRINDELVATWGNLVNRVVSMTHRYFGGMVPAPADLDTADEALLAAVDTALEEGGRQLAAVRLRGALGAAMGAAQAANQYLSEKQPWATAKDDEARTATTLWVALQAISGIAAALGPYLPFTTRKVFTTLGLEIPDSGPRWLRLEVPANTRIGEAEPLYSKVEPSDDGV